MTPAPQREEDLFQAAAQLTGSRRALFLEDQCRENAALRDRLERLLAAHDLRDSFMADLTRELPTVPNQNSPAAPEEAGTMEPARRFGNYRIIRPLGKGGMGAVYEAEEIQSGRRVALKVLTQSLDLPQARQRFLREGLLAASVNHPNTVYVFGTEEINGAPVIAMELVSGGTLHERVKQNGPMLTSEAVDAILQVIDGLEAAAAHGVLHRDVKPSNCFVDSDGTVKVGDFGISISTLARTETNLTATGALLGTPAYASPEQLRGDELDERSDIYSVGATLYNLLTGRTPFESPNMVQLLAAVLEKPAESPAKLQPNLPRGLANIVLQCLAKQPAQRIESYDYLRQALWPFSSSAKRPAPLHVRFLAGCVDYVTYSLISIFLLRWEITSFVWLQARMPWLMEGRFADLLLTLCNACAFLLYYAVPEGLWGASLGKAACGLRMTGSGGGPAGLPRALLRAFLFPTLIFTFAILGNAPDLVGFSTWPFSLVLWTLVLAVIFSTARRRNQFAGLHDLASGTRVTLARNRPAKTSPAQADEAPGATENLVRIGPYHVLSALSTTTTHELLLGYDARLLRKVWILKSRESEAPVSAARRDLSRRTRLRWLTGKRAQDEAWDAFEAVQGKPLLECLQRPQPWAIVRNWFRDLAQEIELGLKDQTLPAVLNLERIWIGADGRARFLEFSAPGLTASAPAGPDSSAPSAFAAPRFLKQVVLSALHGRVAPTGETVTLPIQPPLPLQAQNLITDSWNSQNIETLNARLRGLLDEPAAVTRPRRCLSILMSFWLVLMGGATTGLILAPLVMEGVQSEPDLELLRGCLARIATLQEARSGRDNYPAAELQALEIYTAARFHKTIRNWFVWGQQGVLPAEWRAMARKILESHPQPDAHEFKEAASRLQPFLATYRPAKSSEWLGSSILRGLGFMIAAPWLQFMIVPSLIASMLLRGGVILHLTGLALVTRTGGRASRGRALARGLLSWSPALLMPLGLPVVPEGMYFFLALLAILAGVTAALVTPNRALQDRLAGTWLVPN